MIVAKYTLDCQKSQCDPQNL